MRTMKTVGVWWPLGSVLWALGAVSGSAQPANPAPVDGILAAFRTADVVCLGEHNHASILDSDLRIAVVKHPDFGRLVDTIVVEFAEQARQDILDRFILEGADLSRRELAAVWRDSGSAELWEAPVYEAFFRAVREVNLTLPKDRRVRVIAGDRAPDWAQVRTAADLAPFLTPEFTNRGKFIRDTIAREALDKHRKTLAIYGAAHCSKLGGGFPGELSAAYPGRIWAVYSFLHGAPEQRGLAAFNLAGKAAYVPVAGTPFADLAASDFFAVRLPNAKVGSIVDAVVTFGTAQDDMSPTDLTAFRAEMGAEMERRSRLMAEARTLASPVTP
jgi:hypothetical protein